jgi:hypothetical protein
MAIPSSALFYPKQILSYKRQITNISKTQTCTNNTITHLCKQRLCQLKLKQIRDETSTDYYNQKSPQPMMTLLIERLKESQVVAIFNRWRAGEFFFLMLN